MRTLGAFEAQINGEGGGTGRGGTENAHNERKLKAPGAEEAGAGAGGGGGSGGGAGSAQVSAATLAARARRQELAEQSKAQLERERAQKEAAAREREAAMAEAEAAKQREQAALAALAAQQAALAEQQRQMAAALAAARDEEAKRRLAMEHEAERQRMMLQAEQERMAREAAELAARKEAQEAAARRQAEERAKAAERDRLRAEREAAIRAGREAQRMAAEQAALAEQEREEREALEAELATLKLSQQGAGGGDAATTAAPPEENGGGLLAFPNVTNQTDVFEKGVYAWTASNLDDALSDEQIIDALRKRLKYVHSTPAQALAACVRQPGLANAPEAFAGYGVDVRCLVAFASQLLYNVSEARGARMLSAVSGGPPVVPVLRFLGLFGDGVGGAAGGAKLRKLQPARDVTDLTAREKGLLVSLHDYLFEQRSKMKAMFEKCDLNGDVSPAPMLPPNITRLSPAHPSVHRTRPCPVQHAHAACTQPPRLSSLAPHGGSPLGTPPWHPPRHPPWHPPRLTLGLSRVGVLSQGVVSIEEFLLALEKAGIVCGREIDRRRHDKGSISEEEATRIVGFFDRDGDGELSYSEFMRALQVRAHLPTPPILRPFRPHRQPYSGLHVHVHAQRPNSASRVPQRDTRVHMHMHMPVRSMTSVEPPA